MNDNITPYVRYIGADDKDLDLFESQYVVPQGISYNSYVITDEKIAVMDTIDQRKTEEWTARLEEALEGRTPDYLIVQHMEPDHAANIGWFAEKYPEATIVASAKAIQMMPQFFEEVNFAGRTQTVKEGDTLCLGQHTLKFIMAPMVHWPEVMLTYEESEKILFSADAFGKFGALCHEGEWPVLKENLGYYIGLYDTWSKYKPETEGVVVAYASIHGNTAAAARRMAEILSEKGAAEVMLIDLCRDDMALAVESAFRYSKMIVAASSYDAGVFPPMFDFLHHLQIKNFQKRRVGIIENGSWAPTAGRMMSCMLSEMKNMEIMEHMVTIKSSMKKADLLQMEELAEELLATE